MYCEVCGNEIGQDTVVCRFCGSRQEEEFRQARTALSRKTVNLKYGRPTVETALRRLTVEIGSAKNEGVSILVVIHGYGSSGKGGAIREECRKLLDHMRGRKEIGGFVPGDGGGKSGPVKALFRRFPQLRNDRDFVIANPGMTTVLL